MGNALSIKDVRHLRGYAGFAKQLQPHMLKGECKNNLFAWRCVWQCAYISKEQKQFLSLCESRPCDHSVAPAWRALASERDFEGLAAFSHGDRPRIALNEYIFSVRQDYWKFGCLCLWVFCLDGVSVLHCLLVTAMPCSAARIHGAEQRGHTRLVQSCEISTGPTGHQPKSRNHEVQVYTSH